MERPTFEVADIFRRYGQTYRVEHEGSMSPVQRRVMQAIEACRTAALGGHRERCDNADCSHQRIAYNSCRNRHCPKCQSLARAAWIEDRQAELLNCPYFHVVFTLPEEIAAIAYQNKAVLYNLLFAATAETLRTVAADPKHLGAEIGFFAVLHTWGQNLMHHPHLHCVVPGGGLSPDGTRWVSCRPGFFLPVRVLSRFFRRCFLERLQRAFDRGELKFFSALRELADPHAFARYLAPVRKKEWVVYAKAPFAGPEQVLDYVGRYTHRVAISNNRLVDIEDGHVSFRWKDYRDGEANKTLTLEASEFIRRFLLHTLPPGLQRIRYYGFLGNRHRQEKLRQCRELLPDRKAPAPPQPTPAAAASPSSMDYRDQHEALTGISLRECPLCRRGQMNRIEQILPQRPSLVRVFDTS
ncbi:MAG: IS91 family transposase [Candidatus Dormibacteraceae bacterium]